MKQIQSLYIIVFICITMSYCLYGQGQVQDKRNQETYYWKNQSISFFPDGTYELKQLPSFVLLPNIPVLSYGKYIRYKKYAYYLFSDTTYDCWHRSAIQLTGTESHSPDSNYIIDIVDTVNEHDSCSIIDYLTRKEVVLRFHYYNVRVYYDRFAFFDYRKSNPTFNFHEKGIHQDAPLDFYIELTTHDNKIEFQNPLQLPIGKIKIKIMGAPMEYFWEYVVQDTSANNFVINIPERVYLRLYFQEFNSDVVIIIDKKSIGFSGHIWQKKDEAFDYYMKANTRQRKIWSRYWTLPDPYYKGK